MRETLFRGKRVDNDEWAVSGDIFLGGKRKYIYIPNPDTDMSAKAYLCREVIPETVGQYTGLTDKNGRKIFEGDICSFVDFHSGSDMETYCEGVWEYEDCYFYITNRLSCETTDLICEGKFDGYVIGNIHDNPELLKEGADNDL